MNSLPETPAATLDQGELKLITSFFWAVLGAAGILSLAILFISGEIFLAISNYLQITAAIIGSLVFVYAWRRCGREAFIYAAGGFGVWGVANVCWYINVLLGQRALVFPSIIDLGMIASFFLLAVAFHKGFPEKDATPHLRKAVCAACLIMGFGVVLIPGTKFPLETPQMATILYFLACGIFLEECIRYPGIRNAELFAGSLLFAVSFMIYPLREMFFLQNPVLPVIGTFVAAGFSLIIIGWLTDR